MIMMIIVMMTTAISGVIMMMLTSVREERISLVAIEPGYSLNMSLSACNDKNYSSWMWVVPKTDLPPEWARQIRCVRSADSTISGHHLAILEVYQDKDRSSYNYFLEKREQSCSIHGT